MRRPLLNALLFFPVRRLLAAPQTAHEEVAIETADGERLHAWWIPAAERPIGHVLFCHGNGGNISRRHYPFVPAVVVPDAFPSLGLVGDLRAPLLVLHGDRDELVPLMFGQQLYDAAAEPKRLHVLAGAGHNDLVERAGNEWAAAIAQFAREHCGG